MAEAKTGDLMEKIVSLCKRRGFIFQSSEIYGGINGFWDYGPLGAELKRNIKDFWWNTMTRQREDVVGLDATIIMHPQIWKASGHVDTFADMMVECPLTNKRFRADQVEPQSGVAYSFSMAIEASLVLEKIRKTPNKAPNERPPYFSADQVAKMDSEKSRIEAAIVNSGLTDGDFQKFQEHYRRSYPSNDPRSRGIFLEPITILIQQGKHPESARKRAVEFYKKLGMVGIPYPVADDDPEEIQASQGFNPDNGVKLTQPRPFNLMFKTYVGPVGGADIPSLDRDGFSQLLDDPPRREALTANLVESQKSVAYLRPETAQAIFAQFKNVLDSSRVKVPFGIAQVGKAFRNEVTPRNFTFRSREFEQMELEFFIPPDEAVEAISGSVAGADDVNLQSAIRSPQSNWGWEAWHKYWVEERIGFYESIGLPRNTLVEYWQRPEELAHYARATVDILYKFPFSKRDAQGELMGEELEGIAARSDFDLSQHQRFSGKSMTVFDEELKTAWPKLDPEKQAELKERYHQNRLTYLTKTGVAPEKAEILAREDAEALTKGYYIPHVIEPSAGADRLALALICNAYSEDQAPDEKGKMETRVVLRFHPRIAPIKVAVFPLLKNKPDLVTKAKEVRDLLRPWMNVFYDEAGAIGRRYRRQDEIGTPFGVTIDFDTLGEKGPELKDTVTLRDRDTMKQERVKISELLPLMLEKIR